MGGRRVLVTGLGTFWGGRIAQALERDPSVEVIVGISWITVIFTALINLHQRIGEKANRTPIVPFSLHD